MSNQFDFAAGIIAGADLKASVTVRETYWGYIVRSEAPRTNLSGLTERIARFVRRACWVAVLGLWLYAVYGFSPEIFWLTACVTGAILALTYMGVSLLRRRTGYEVQVDTSRDELRTAVVSSRGGSKIRSVVPFAEVADMVMHRGKGEAPSLWVRLKRDKGSLIVARGDESTLLAIHDRLSRDLTPVEERLSGLGLRGKRGARAVRAFPKLAPDEVAA